MASGALEAAEPQGAAAPPPVEGKEEELPEKSEVEEADQVDREIAAPEEKEAEASDEEASAEDDDGDDDAPPKGKESEENPKGGSSVEKQGVPKRRRKSSAAKNKQSSHFSLQSHRLGAHMDGLARLVARVIDPFLIPHPSLALGFFDWASQQPGFAHDPLTYRSVLKSLSASRQSNAVEALLKRVRARGISLDASAYGHVIACFVRNKRTHDGFLVFSEIGSLVGDVGPDVCNLLLAALASDGYIDNARKVFDEMMQWGVRLSTLGLGVFLWKFCGNGEISEVLSALDEVRRRNAGINGSVIAVLVVHGLCQASRVSEALSGCWTS
ncbi:pentatricopeptide repeat-containing protein At5g14080-like [Syzygium oleosum]|uniref:pentatricopeptide repeat-containing protein At5g14080-like n=1 Tax=Syzygium oleosum TaxID=219896 RepID=UPI0024BAC2A6|nr:pentatricopeptide repeat-containing protein At5g14080-like [Syzygium oleosum]